VKFATALLTCSCGSSSQMVCRATFNSTVVSGFGWVYSSGMASRCSSPAGANLESFNEPAKVRLQQVLDDARNAEKLGLSSFRQHNFVIFICILTKLCGKVYVHTSSVKISCKNRHALLKRQQESGGFLFSGRQLCIVQAISSNL